VRAFLGPAGRPTELRPWAPPTQTSTDGVVRIAGPAGALLGVGPGTWDVVLVVGREGALPADAAAMARALAGDAGLPGDQIFTRRIRIDEPRSP
jgi:hypothetical protein